MTEKPILVYAEDNTGMRNLTVTVLSHLGFDVRACVDGQQAFETLQALKAEGKAPVAVLTDGNMPIMDGDELIRKAHELFPEARLVIGSGAVGEDDKRFSGAAAELGAAYLTKPFGMADLRRVLPDPKSLAGEAKPLAIIINHHDVASMALTERMQRRGYEVMAFTDAGSAVTAMNDLAAKKRAPDFILADYRTNTGEDGLEALQAARALFDQTPMALTGFHGRTDLREESERIKVGFVDGPASTVEEIEAGINQSATMLDIPKRVSIATTRVKLTDRGEAATSERDPAGAPPTDLGGQAPKASFGHLVRGTPGGPATRGGPG